MEICKATIKQGSKKGQQCWRISSENGQCGIHQIEFKIQEGIEKGLHKCATHRCTEMIHEKQCETCTLKKTEIASKLTICRALITQGSNKGKQCDKESSTPEGFCGKHKINIKIEEAAKEEKRICDDGKRSCKKFTKDGKLKCEDCLEKDRLKDHEKYAVKKEEGLCLDCGCELTEKMKGFRKEVQRCAPCYEKLQETEKKRVRDRNQKEERKNNNEIYYNQQERNSAKRNIQFELTLDDFENIVTQPCQYCGYFKENEVIGIDRINSNCGYTIENVVSACSTCNMMKNDLSQHDFKEHIIKIQNSFANKTTEEITIPTISSYIKPKYIVKKYRENTLDSQIELCIQDNRSVAFINKLKTLQTLSFNEIEARRYIKSALHSEQISKSNAIHSRINRKEMFGYLQLKKTELCIAHYEKVHGIPDGFKNDIQILVHDWSDDDTKNQEEFNRIIIKYQNKRNS